MHLFQRGQQFGSCWRSLKSSLSAPVLNPCWNTVLNLSMLIKHLLIEVFLCKTKWVVIATLHVSGMWAEPQTGQIQQYLSPIRNEWVAAQKPGILTHTHWCHFEFLCFSFSRCPGDHSKAKHGARFSVWSVDVFIFSFNCLGWFSWSPLSAHRVKAELSRRSYAQVGF